MLIHVERLEKTFRVAEQRSGLFGAMGSLVYRKYRLVRAVSEADDSKRKRSAFREWLLPHVFSPEVRHVQPSGEGI